jgi:hypothetical protein
MSAIDMERIAIIRAEVAALEKMTQRLRDAVDRLNARDRERDCTCTTPVARSTDIDPPEYKSIRDKWCPVHGRDPDAARDEMLERQWDREIAEVDY